LFKLTFMDGSVPRVHQLREVDRHGRAQSCDLVITAALMSRQHARVRVDPGKKVYLRDAGSTYGTTFKGVKLTGEQELSPGDSFTLGPVTLTLDREVHESEVLSESHQIFEEAGTIVKRVDQLELPPSAALAPSDAPAPPPKAAPTPAGRAAARGRDGSAPAVARHRAAVPKNGGHAVCRTASRRGSPQGRSGPPRGRSTIRPRSPGRPSAPAAHRN
jgi:hypothetical protein